MSKESGGEEKPLLYPSSHLLSFGMETRSVCTADQKVKYSSTGGSQRETLWSLPIPMELAQLPAAEDTPMKEEGDGPEQKRHKSGAATDDGSHSTATTDVTDRSFDLGERRLMWRVIQVIMKFLTLFGSNFA